MISLLSFQVQSKPEKKPGTPPPAPVATTATPAPTPRSPSPPPAPVIVTPPPPAINIPRFYYPRGLPALGPAANHDAEIAAIETVFTEFEEEKADIYEMGKVAKVKSHLSPNLFFRIEQTLLRQRQASTFNSSRAVEMPTSILRLEISLHFPEGICFSWEITARSGLVKTVLFLSNATLGNKHVVQSKVIWAVVVFPFRHAGVHFTGKHPCSTQQVVRGRALCLFTRSLQLGGSKTRACSLKPYK